MHYLTYVEKRINIHNGNSFAYVGHNYKQLNYAICCVKKKKNWPWCAN